MSKWESYCVQYLVRLEGRDAQRMARSVDETGVSQADFLRAAVRHLCNRVEEGIETVDLRGPDVVDRFEEKVGKKGYCPRCGDGLACDGSCCDNCGWARLV